MTPTQNNKATTQKQVFDLGTFTDVLLKKDYELPVKPTSVEEALAAVGNDQDKFLSIVHEGLKAHAREQAYNSNDGWQVTDEEGDVTGPYTGTAADEKVGKLIDAAILSMAKVLGYEKSLAPEKKRELKSQAMEFIKSNKAMIDSIKKQAGVPDTPAAENPAA